MRNYKKSLLSLVAITALSSSAMGSSYLPLANTSNDSQWILFGVNGYKINGGAPAETAIFSVHGAASDTQVTDSTADDLAVAGLNATAGDATTAMAEVKALYLGGTGELTSITANVDSLSTTYSTTEPIRTMYIKAQGNSYADAQFTYKASLEGLELEFQINGDATKTYKVTISALNTFDNPAARTEKVPAGAFGGVELKAISDASDFDFANNPADPEDYLKEDHQTENASASSRFYGYNSTSSSWEVYDSANNALSNDFTELKKGKAYWGKMDTGDGTTASTTEAGLVLGSTGLVDADYTGEINAGWNLMSFDATIPDIRTSTTGILATRVGDGDLNITDASGNHTITYTIVGGQTTEVIAQQINIAIESAKAFGDMPASFDFRAFRSSATELAFISNKKFTLQDEGDNFGLSNVKTLAGGNVWDNVSNTLVDLSASDMNTSISSVYGEYALLVEPLVGAGTASQLDANASATGPNASASIQVNDELAVPISNGAGTDAVATIATFAAAATSITGIDGAVALDLDNNGSSEHVIIAANATSGKFYLRDHTFTRVYTVDGTNADDTEVFTIKGSKNSATVAPTAADSYTEFAADIQVRADDSNDTGVYAVVNGGNRLVVISAAKDTSSFDLVDSYNAATQKGEFLKDSSSSADVAKGAIKAVYALNTIAKQTIVPNTVYFDISSDAAAGGSDHNITLNGTTSAFMGIAAITGDATTRLAFMDNIVTKVNAQLKAQSVQATATHNYESGDFGAFLSRVTVTGYGITSLTYENNDTGVSADLLLGSSDTNSSAATPTFGLLATPIGSLTADLKYNAIYTPDYAVDGPLYTLKDAGFDMQAIITGSTDLTTGAIAWDSLDLTRNPKDWLKNQDYNLFNVDGKSGYWVYLAADATTNSLAIDSVVLNPSFVHHFTSNVDTTAVHTVNTAAGADNKSATENILRATLQLEVSGLPTDTTPVRVYANVGGSKVELSSSLNNGIYSGTLSSYEVQSMNAGSAFDITAQVSNGLGYSLNNISAATIDYEKPAMPTVALSTGADVAIASTSVDTTGFYVYKDLVPENNADTSSNKIAKLLVADAAAYNICATDGIKHGLTYTMKAFAMDGTAATSGGSSDGQLGFGNASDVYTFNYTPTIKSAHILSNTEGTDTEASSLGVIYDSSCATNATATENFGMSIKAVTSSKTVKLSYVPRSTVSFSTDVPYTIYVGTSAAGLAQIKYVPAYAGDRFYVELDNVVYEGNFPSDDSAKGNSSSALDVSATIIVGQKLP
jgi:hypothetical protein